MSKIITLDRLSNFLTNLKGLFVTKTDANSTYATKEELNSAKTTADDTYETKTDAATHLTKIDAKATYATKTELTTAENNASNTYLSKTDAADTYATKAENNTKANNSEVVHKSGDETIAGTKNFSSQIKGNISGSSTSCTGNSASATKATQDSAGQRIDTTYIKSLAVSGRTITYTKGDGSTGTITTQDTNTWTAFKGATSSANGTAGLVPAPAAGTQAKYLRGDGTWQTPPNTTYASMSASEATTGTDTAARTISAKVLHDKINSNLSAYSKVGHTHDDRYYTETEVNNLLKGKANTSGTYNSFNAGNGVDSSGNGWIRFRNGIQICWAEISCKTSGASTWTYGASFSSRPVVTVCDNGSNTKLVYQTRAGDIGKTSCLIVMVYESGGSNAAGEAQCIAIGRWK